MFKAGFCVVIDQEAPVGVEPTCTGLQPVASPSGSSAILLARFPRAFFFQSSSLKVVVAIDAVKNVPIAGNNA